MPAPDAMAASATPSSPKASLRTRFVVTVLASVVLLPLAFVALCFLVGQDLSAFEYGRPAMFLVAASLVCGLALAPIRFIPLSALVVVGPVLTFLAMAGPAILFGG